MTVRCKSCNKNFFEDYRKDKSHSKRSPAKYCSRECSNRRFHSDEVKERIAEKLRKHPIKICSECSTILQWNNKSGFCKKCKKPSKTRSEFVIDHRRKRKRQFIEYKGGRCISCGYTKCPDALEFHHRNKETKEITPSDLWKYRWEAALKELDKCDLLCSNCHREKHWVGA
jgi:hypothetical protein